MSKPPNESFDLLDHWLDRVRTVAEGYERHMEAAPDEALTYALGEVGDMPWRALDAAQWLLALDEMP